MTTPAVGVIMGSDSDLPVMHGAIDILDKFGVPSETHIVSAHRTPEWMIDGLLDLYAWLQLGEGSNGSAVTHALHEILGRPPRTFEAFVRENVAAFGG